VETSREAEVLAEFEAGVRAHLGPRVFDGVDGRVANRLRNRDSVIDALIELLREGKAGTVDEVVERSGVARRSVFRYFNDLSDLTLTAFHRVLAESLPLVTISNVGEGTRGERIDVYVDTRLRSLKIMRPFRTAARTRFATSASLPAVFAVTLQLVRNQVTSQFAAELGTLNAPDAERLVDALIVLTSAESYELLAGQMDRAEESIRAMWLSAIRSLLHMPTPAAE
jgi:AcrR family transcriptional regulator